jgi:hypothetical protein
MYLENDFTLFSEIRQRSFHGVEKCHVAQFSGKRQTVFRCNRASGPRKWIKLKDDHGLRSVKCTVASGTYLPIFHV